jgi:hypothetical protein
MALIENILAYWSFNDDGSGGVSLVDSTGNGNDLIVNSSPNPSLGTGIIEGDAVGNGSGYYTTTNSLNFSGDFSINYWTKNPVDNTTQQFCGSSNGGLNFCIDPTTIYYGLANVSLNASYNFFAVPNTWYMATLTRQSGNVTLYLNGTSVATNIGDTSNYSDIFGIFATNDGQYPEHSNNVNIDEIGVWNRALSGSEITVLYNNGLGNTYPFALNYNNAQNDGDWGNLLNWWLDSGFTIQATALPTATNPVNLYNQVTQNTQGANQCFCSSANFWSANFGAGLTLQSTGVVNVQGTSIFAGTTTDGVSMHDSSRLASTSVVDGNVTMRDSSRAFGSILGNATIYYDGGNGQYPIGGIVAGSVTYVGWPAISPQWFNDQVSGGGNDGDFSNKANWWTDNTFTARPINAEGTQELPDASTDVFIAPNTGITANTGTANPTVNSVTANNSNIQNISITATNGFLFSGNEGAENATLYGNVTFQDTAYSLHSVIQGTATYKSAVSLQNSWSNNSLGNINQGASYGSTGFVVNIPGGGGGFISRLLNFPWFIKF